MNMSYSNRINLWKCHRSNWDGGISNFDILSDLEKAKAERYKITDDQKRFCIGRIMVRSIVGNYLDIDGKDIDILINDHGKPYINGVDGFKFNISHSGDWVVAAFSGCDVGVDVQEVCLDKKIDFENVAKYAFHKDEITYIREASADEQRRRFYDVWCVKEALIKAKGVGFYGNLDDFCVLPMPDEKGSNIGGVRIKNAYIDEKHVAAIAIVSNELLEIKEFDF